MSLRAVWPYIDEPGSQTNAVGPKPNAEVYKRWRGFLAGQYNAMGLEVRLSISYFIPNS